MARPAWRALLTLLLIAIILGLPQAPQTAHAISTALVISQVYGGGGNSGATYTHDYVELFNRGSAPASLNGLSIQYTSATGTGSFGSSSTQLTELPNVMLQPGQYYLVQQASQAAVGAPLPTPDLVDSTPIPMAGTAGKVALVTGTTGLGCNGGSTPCSQAQLDRIVDLVGYGTGASGANFFEGAGAAPTLSNTTAALRGSGGCAETDNNNADFTALAPTPRNTSSPTNVCGGGGGPTNPSATGTANPSSVGQGAQTTLTVTVTPGTNPTSTGITVTGDLSSIGGSASQAFVAGPGNTFTLQATVSAGTTPGPKTLPISVSDAESRTASTSISLTVTTAAVTRIREIQGASQLSPLATTPPTQVFNVPGVVTARRSNGFYIQDDDPDSGPGNALASSGIFVFTNSAPSASIQVGERVTVNGTVAEFVSSSGCGPVNLPLTEITSPTVTESNVIVALPAPIVVGAGGRVPPSTIIDNDSTTRIDVAGPPAQGSYDPTEDGIDFWERLEGMRVQLNNAQAVGPTNNGANNNINEIPVIPDGVIGSPGTNPAFGLMTPRGGIKVRPNDFNPERVFLDDGILAASAIPDVNVGAIFPGATVGVIDYSFCNFKLVVSDLPAPTGGVTRETTSLVGGDRLTVASFNVENLTDADPDAKFAGLAQTIVSNLKAPDILTIEEIQDNNGVTEGGTNSSVVASNEVWAKLIAAIAAQPNGPTYTYRQIDPEAHHDGGAPGGNIRVGFLFRTDRGLQFVPRIKNGLDCSGASPTPAACATTATSVQAVAGKPELTLSPGRVVDPSSPDTDPNNAFVASRKPLVGEFLYKNRPLFVIANHFNSKGGDEALFGRFQPPNLVTETQRHKQATLLNAFIKSILDIDPQAYVIAGGDFNDFDFSQTLNILRTGSPSNTGNEEMVNLYQLLPENERYSYVFEGNSQILDHILASPGLFNNASPIYDVVHVNAEFWDQQSDHDPQVASFNVPVGQGRAEAHLTPDVLDFGDAALGAAPIERSVLLTNTGLVPLTVSALTLDGPAASDYSVVSPTGPVTLHAGQTQTIVVRFAPTARGPRNARLIVGDDAPGERRVALRGTGQGPEAAIAPERVSFGRVQIPPAAPPSPRTVTIFNTGLAPLTISAVNVTGPDAASFPLNNPPAPGTVIPAGGTAEFIVGFTPTQRRGYSARIEVAHNGTGELRVPLNGQGVLANEGGGSQPRPEANLTPNVVPFGNVPLGSTSATRMVVLTNTGDAPLIVSNIGLSGAQAGDFSLTVPPLAPIAPGDSLAVEVRFAPTVRGQRSAVLTITDNAPGERRATLRGVGQGPEAAFTPDRLTFGQVQVGSSLTRTVTLTNTGLAPLHITSATVTGSTADYSVTPGGAGIVAPGATYTLNVTCTPSTVGQRAARLEVQDDAIGERRVNLVCIGTNGAP